MPRANALRKWTRILAAVAAATACVAATAGAAAAGGPPREPGEARSDVIVIDTLRQFGSLQRPAVAFLHDAHTRALARKQKDCQECHLADDKGTRSLKFKRLADSGRQAVMDTYHLACIGCHRETRAAGEKRGPQTCGECHRPGRALSSRQPMGFDLSLHQRHAKASENKCDACHHAYDPATRKLFYDKGQEGTCRYCHGQTAVPPDLQPGRRQRHFPEAGRPFRGTPGFQAQRPHRPPVHARLPGRRVIPRRCAVSPVAAAGFRPYLGAVRPIGRKA